MVPVTYDKEKGVQHEKRNLGSRTLFLRFWDFFKLLGSLRFLDPASECECFAHAGRIKDRWVLLKESAEKKAQKKNLQKQVLHIL